MKRKTVIINNVILFGVVMALVFIVALINNAYHGSSNLALSFLFYVIGAFLWGLINAFVHEFGHILGAKKNGFKVMSLSVWFFKWTRIKNRFSFDFTFLGEEAGATETVPVGDENLPKRYRNMTIGGIVSSAILTIISVVPLFFCKNLDFKVFCLLSVSLPVSAYYFLGSVLPMVYEGVKNDGATIIGLNKMDDSAKVLCSVLSIHAGLYSGKTPSEIDEKLYFDVPQLPEDDLNFIALLSARYSYYLDKEDFENAKKISDRLISLEDELPKAIMPAIKADALYNACTFDYSEEKADELMYELDKYLNSVNNATNVRIKLAYVIYVEKNLEPSEMFYNKGVKEATRSNIKGLGIFEKKLLDKMKKDFPTPNEEENSAE